MNTSLTEDYNEEVEKKNVIKRFREIHKSLTKKKMPNKEKKDLIELTEIWVPTKEGGEAIMFRTAQRFKRVAILNAGKIIFLDNEVRAEKKMITKEELINYPK